MKYFLMTCKTHTENKHEKNVYIKIKMTHASQK